ncbi:response regulator [Sphingomonas panacisoli]|uniref:histidine kinase n=1 Tax=Sphingomonas panacisoli TaxID=1813879 RepID=A0A5B8LGK5_9SPHN|nr:response regulator [Sphingomonas panacisoli]QDZ06784.1 response regulator [Sphingomonas panacisoli]
MDGRERGAQRFLSAAEWRQIIDSAVDTAIITTDTDGKVTSWSDGATAILGWQENEMLGRTLEPLFPDDLGPAALEREMAEARSAGKGGGTEGWRVRKDGTQIWATGEMTPIYGGPGDIVGFTKVLRDRSTQRAAEAALIEERRALEILNRAGSALAVETDLETLVQIVTDAGVDLTGAQFGAFFYNVLDAAGESYMLYTLSGVPAEAFAKFPMPRNTAVFAPTFNGEGIVRSDDITKDARYGKNAPRKGMPDGHLPVRSYLAVPVTSRTGDVIGGLFFGHEDVGVFTDQSERGLEGLAAEAAVAIDNARLFRALELELHQRRTAEIDLAVSEDRLRLANDAAEIGTWDFDPISGALRWDDKCKALFGLGAHAEITYERSFLAGLHPEDRARADAAVQAALATGGSGVYDIEYRTVGIEDGVERWLVATGRAIFENDVAVRFIGTVIDITARKHIEDSLRELNERLEEKVAAEVARRGEAEEALRQAQKMEAVGQLTGGIAHDFNNLLTVVTGNIGMAQRALDAREASDPRATRALDNAMKGAERAAALTQRLLAFSRRQPLAPKPVDADRLVAGMSDMLQRSLGETVRLETVTSPGLWRTEADPNQLESAILNLALNARDAMPSGGQLTIETANTRLDESYAATQAEVPPGQYVMIAVTDTGSGMSRQVVARAFEPFFTTKEVGKGTGLGLSMIYGFVKQSGGHIKIYSEEGEGTTVKIYLPRLLSAAAETFEPASTASGLEGSARRETVMVVEDDDDVRAYTVECLRELGYRVIEAHDGQSALRLLERQEDEIALLLTDVVMPNMSGRELTIEARKYQPGLRVLYTSGYTRNAIVHGGRLDPGVELIGKPFSFEALAQKVRDVIDSNSGTILIVDSDPAMRFSASQGLEASGFRTEEAGTGLEALSKVRAAQGCYGAVIIDDALADRAGNALLRELRALYCDLPILLATSVPHDEALADIADDRCIALIGRPYTARELNDALDRLGMSCRRNDD